MLFWLACACMCVAGCQRNAVRTPRETGADHTTITRVSGMSGRTMLTPALWRNIESTPDFSTSLPDDPASPPNPPTPDIADLWHARAYLAWDPETLYVMIESTGPRPAATLSKSGPLHGGDVCEIFMDVSGDRRQLVEIQISPDDRAYSFWHVWTEAPRYPADHVDEPFYHAHHSAEKNWRMTDLRVCNTIEPLGPENFRWRAYVAVPMRRILERSGLPPQLKAGQPMNINILRYAYHPQRPELGFRQYNLVPTRHGCPHQSPMAAVKFVTMK